MKQQLAHIGALTPKCSAKLWHVHIKKKPELIFKKKNKHTVLEKALIHDISQSSQSTHTKISTKKRNAFQKKNQKNKQNSQNTKQSISRQSNLKLIFWILKSSLRQKKKQHLKWKTIGKLRKIPEEEEVSSYDYRCNAVIPLSW